MNRSSAISPSQQRNRFYVVLVVAAALVATIFFSSTPISSHASGITGDVVRVVNEISPQGWGFFTKDPREPFITAYVAKGSEEWTRITRGPNAHPRNAFGLNRESRLDEYDHSQLIGSKELTDLWVDCTGEDVPGCAKAALEGEGVQEWQVVGYDLRLCGDVLLLRQELIPFDYAGLDYDPSTQAIRAEIVCTLEEQP